MRKTLPATAWLLIFTCIAEAQDSTRVVSPMSESWGAALTKMLVSLFLILALIVLLGYLAKRYLPRLMGGPIPAATQDRKIDVVASRPLGPRRMIYLLKIGNREFLIGSHEQGMSVLGNWDQGKPENTFDAVLQDHTGHTKEDA